MIFVEEYNNRGVKLKVKMLSVKEINEHFEKQSNDFDICKDVLLDKDNKPMFKDVEDIKEQLPPKVITEIVHIALSVEKKQ